MPTIAESIQKRPPYRHIKRSAVKGATTGDPNGGADPCGDPSSCLPFFSFKRTFLEAEKYYSRKAVSCQEYMGVRDAKLYTNLGAPYKKQKSIFYENNS
jgi:hypothetical protein